MRKQIRKISFILVVAMLVSAFAPVSYAEAAAEPYKNVFGYYGKRNRCFSCGISVV